MNNTGIGYEIFHRRIQFTGRLILLSGLRIGEGRAIGPNASDLPVLKDISGNPFIPGSSLKGVLRANLEAWLRSFQGHSRPYLACCQVSGHGDLDGDLDNPTASPCISNSMKQKWVKEFRDQPGKLDAMLWERSCWICRSFGSPWIASKVHFLDLPVIKEGWRNELLSIRDGVAIDRESETAATSKKFDFEVVPPDTIFEFEMLIENPEDYEMGLLMLAFDLLNSGWILMGGGKSRGLGRVQIEIDNIEETTPLSIIEKYLQPPPIKTTEGTSSPEPSLPEPSFSPDQEVKAIKPQFRNKFQRAVYECVCAAGSLTNENLITKLKEQGITREDIRGVYGTWQRLFDACVAENIISETDGQYHLIGVSPTSQSLEAESAQDKEDSQAKEDRRFLEERCQAWKEVLHQKLKKILEGEPCLESSTTKPE